MDKSNAASVPIGFCALIKSAVVLLCAAIILSASLEAHAVDGIAVSTKCKHGSYPGSSVLNSGWWGKIVRYDVTGSKVGPETVIYDGMGRYPAISMDGKRVAFFRNGSADGNNETLCDRYGSCGWLSVMNIDGTGLRDLVTLQDAANRNANSLDWPYGDWIYYQKNGTKEIWRVNVSDPSKNMKVCTYENEFRVWALNANAQYAVTQMSDRSEANIPHLFPPKPGLTWIRRNHPSGCNPAMSPGGTFITHFLGTGHVNAIFVRWSPEKDTCYSEKGISNDEMTDWAGADVGRGMDWPRWSCNSDKWVCFKIGWSCDGMMGRFGDAGTNVTIVNWIDNEAITLSNNKKVCDKFAIKYRNDAGDFRVNGPEGKYETIGGEWVDIGTPVDTRYGRAGDIDGAAAGSRTHPRALSDSPAVYDIAGRRIGAHGAARGKAGSRIVIVRERRSKAVLIF